MTADLKVIENLLDAPSLYPDEPRKDRETRRADMIAWAEKYDEQCEYYNLYGMDLADAAPCDTWLDYGIFRKIRFRTNADYFPLGSAFPYNFTLFMRDKLSFEMFTQMVLGKDSKEYVPSVGVIYGKTVYIRNESGALIEIASLEDLTTRFEGQKLVFKQTFGCSGKSVYIVEVQDGKLAVPGSTEEAARPDDFLGTIADPRAIWLVQPYIHQNETLSRLNDTSVNTMRILTFHTGERIVVPDLSIIRYGKKGALLDNADSGGRYTAVDGNGILRDKAYDFVGMGVEDSPFAGMKIEEYGKAVELVKRLHSFIPQLFTVGWDVAFTTDGPAVVEGNDGWDPSLNQPPRGNAMRPVWDSLLAERKENTGRLI